MRPDDTLLGTRLGAVQPLVESGGGEVCTADDNVHRIVVALNLKVPRFNPWPFRSGDRVGGAVENWLGAR